MMMFKTYGIIFFSSLLVGCSGLFTPGTNLPEFDTPTHWDVNSRASDSAGIDEEWWRVFNDTALNSYIEEGLDNNPDLAIAGFNIKQAGLQSGLMNTNLTPNVSSSLSAQSSRPLDKHDASTRLYQSSYALVYEVDLWGKLSNARDAAWWQYNATIYDRMATRLTIIFGISKSYWTIGQINKQIEIARRNVSDAVEQQNIVKSNYIHGGSSYNDVLLMQRNVNGLNAELTSLYSQREENRKSLMVYLARPISIHEVSDFSIDRAIPFMYLPPAPDKVLLNRPDISAAESRLRAHLSDYNMNKRSMLPSITLNGSVVTGDGTLRDLFKNPIGLLNVGIDFPFLQLNTVILKMKISKVQYESAVVSYRKVWGQAIAEINWMLSLQDYSATQLVISDKQLGESRKILNISEALYRSGGGKLKDLLEEQKNFRMAEANGAVLKNNLLQANMQLLISTGGG